VRAGDPLSDWSQIEPYFDQLRERDIREVGNLNQWLLDCSELMACIDEVGTDREVLYTCQTDDPERERAHLDFVEHIAPRCKPRWHELNLKYVQSPAAPLLPQPRFFVFDRSVRNTVELYREENVPLQVDEAKLQQQFQKISGAMTVQFEGKEQTLQQLAVYSERTDRTIRQAAWEAGARRRLQDREPLEDIFDQLFKLRHQMALNAGMRDFRDYIFKAKERFDYTPDDCLAFHDAIERAVVPVMRDMLTRRQRQLGIDRLRPWDLAVDVKGRPPLKPFETSAELCDRCSALFQRVDPELGTQFEEMRRQGFLDLDSRKGKAPGGYQATYYESRHPFIFMNAVGLQRDVRTLIHEGGHAFHAYACRSDPIIHYRSAPIEFAEVASMGMEMLAYDLLDAFYRGEELQRAQQSQLEGIIMFFPWMATIDAFQHWMYTHPDHSRSARRDEWLSLHERFGGIEDYTGYEEALAYGWQRQLHLFSVPFYYVEYGIAQLGALQVWRNARQNRRHAIEAYRAGLALGGSQPLPELFTAAGTKFDFSIDTLGPLMEMVQRELQKLGD
jgi:oligoendopeptidase F